MRYCIRESGEAAGRGVERGSGVVVAGQRRRRPRRCIGQLARRRSQRAHPMQIRLVLSPPPPQHEILNTVWTLGRRHGRPLFCAASCCAPREAPWVPRPTSPVVNHSPCWTDGSVSFISGLHDPTYAVNQRFYIIPSVKICMVCNLRLPRLQRRNISQAAWCCAQADLSYCSRILRRTPYFERRQTIGSNLAFFGMVVVISGWRVP